MVWIESKASVLFPILQVEMYADICPAATDFESVLLRLVIEDLVWFIGIVYLAGTEKECIVITGCQNIWILNIRLGIDIVESRTISSKITYEVFTVVELQKKKVTVFLDGELVSRQRTV